MTHLEPHIEAFLVIYVLGAIAVALAWASNRHTPDAFNPARIILWPIWFIGAVACAIYDSATEKDG